MSKQFLEVFFISFAWSFWPTLFILLGIYVVTKLVGKDSSDKYNTDTKIKKKEFYSKTEDDIPTVEKEFKMPKIETSFGNQRIGDVHEHGKKT
jgi:hypothetical protein|tara:strand:- start:1080 stop:1358 length:279 start_codon:yes stop_codon:yes gene_type:complete